MRFRLAAQGSKLASRAAGRESMCWNVCLQKCISEGDCIWQTSYRQAWEIVLCKSQKDMALEGVR